MYVCMYVCLYIYIYKVRREEGNRYYTGNIYPYSLLHLTVTEESLRLRVGDVELRVSFL